MTDARLLWKRGRYCWLLVGLIGSWGCGPRVAAVQGTLKVNSVPLAEIEVYFIPDGEQGTKGPRAAAVTDPEGHFRLDLGDLGYGAVVGHHRVVLVDRLSLPHVPDPRYDKPGTRPRSPQPSRVPSKYVTATTTPLRVDVPSTPKTIDLEIPAP
jgi:hypothetical protein